MPVEFEVKLNQKDMYRFHMYHIYTGIHGLTSILVAIFAFVYTGYSYGRVGTGYTVLYILFGVAFLIYYPVTMIWKSAAQIKAPNGLRDGIRYHVDAEGVRVSVGEESSFLPWKQVYKMVSNRHQILIYSSRIHAYIITRDAVGAQYEALRQCAEQNLEKHRFGMKK